MNFREFLVKEGVDFDLESSMNRVFSNPHFVKHGQSYVNGTFDGNSVVGNIQLPEDLEIPKVERTGTVAALLTKRNPIYMRLSDGTEAMFTFDEWKRIQGEPKVGSVVTLVFQRHPNFNLQQHSKVEQVIVR